MKRALISILVLFVLAPFIYAQNFNGKETVRELSIEKPDKKLNKNENLNYSVEWLGISVGKVSLHMDGIIKIDGVDCYLISAKALPNAFFKKFYDFEYNVNTLIDGQTFLSRRFEKTRRIGKKSTTEIIDFDRKSNTVHYKAGKEAPVMPLSFDRQKLQQDIPQTCQLVPGDQDLFSALYYFRMADVKADERISLNIYYALRNWQVDAYVSRPYIQNFRKKGILTVFSVKLSSVLNRFVLGNQDIDVVFTADSRRVPVLFKFGSGIGTFRGVLEELPK
ncbi:MAG: DUF3108 domain-containing protein [Candidatus Omnitrophota bacterium]